MREHYFAQILGRYGQNVVLEGAGGRREGRAIVQPILEGGEQWVPTPLGRRREERFLYLGGAGLAIDCGDRVECGQTRYRAIRVQAVRVGEGLSHWRAVLRLEEE